MNCLPCRCYSNTIEVFNKYFAFPVSMNNKNKGWICKEARVHKTAASAKLYTLPEVLAVCTALQLFSDWCS